jgi:hypothetical protein
MFVECTHPKSCHRGQKQDSGLQRLRSKVFMSAALHRSRESASLRTGVNKIMTRFVVGHRPPVLVAPESH